MESQMIRKVVIHCSRTKSWSQAIPRWVRRFITEIPYCREWNISPARRSYEKSYVANIRRIFSMGERLTLDSSGPFAFQEYQFRCSRLSILSFYALSLCTLLAPFDPSLRLFPFNFVCRETFERSSFRNFLIGERKHIVQRRRWSRCCEQIIKISL